MIDKRADPKTQNASLNLGFRIINVVSDREKIVLRLLFI